MFGQIGLLVAVIIVIRVLPSGISGWLKRSCASGPEITLVEERRSSWSRTRRWLARLEGAQTIGRGPAFWVVVVVVIAAAAVYPLFTDGYTVGNTVYFFVWIFMALGLCLVWGYGGALSFGQTAFFGLAGYAYGVLTINFGAAYGFTLVALVLAVAVGALFALVLGYFMFFGEIRGVFVGIVTLSVTLVLRDASWPRPPARSGGSAMRAPQRLQRHDRHAVADDPLARRRHRALRRDRALLRPAGRCWSSVYLGLRILVNCPFGNVLVAIRENPERASRCSATTSASIQLVAFVLGGALAGLSGVLYTAWGQYITPSQHGPDGGGAAGHLGAVGGRSRPDLDAGRHARRARRSSRR